MATQPVVVDAKPKTLPLNVYRVVYLTGRTEKKVFAGPTNPNAPDEAKPVDQWVSLGVHKTVNVIATDGSLASLFALDNDKSTVGQIVSVTQIASDVIVALSERRVA